MFKILAVAGIGGTLPTLCRLAAAYSVGANPPLGLGVYVALALFFIIGVAVAFGFGESELRKAFVLGIAAPAIVTSTINSASQGKVSTPAAAPPAASELRDTRASSLAMLFGIADARAQPTTVSPVSPSTRQEQAQLRVTTNVAHGGGYPVDLVELRFLSDSPGVLGSSVVDARVPATVTVPPGARSVMATIDGQTSTTQLPSTSFTSANLRLNIDTSHVSDFLWALGFNRRVRVEGISASIDSVVPAVQAPESQASVSPARAR